MNKNLFDIVVPVEGRALTAVLAVAAARGIALGAHATKEEEFALADDINFLGFLDREVKTLAEIDHLRHENFPVGNLPYQVGKEVTIRRAVIIEAEGSGLLDASVDATCTVGTPLTFDGNGKIKKALTDGTDRYFLVVTANSAVTNSTLSPLVSGNTRIRARVMVP